MPFKVGKQELKQAQSLVAAKCRSSVRRDWLATLKYQFTPPNQNGASECFAMMCTKLTNVTNSKEVRSTEGSGVESAFPQSFRRQRGIMDQLIELEVIENVKFTQQSGMCNPIQLQEAVQNEIA